MTRDRYVRNSIGEFASTGSYGVPGSAGRSVPAGAAHAVPGQPIQVKSSDDLVQIAERRFGSNSSEASAARVKRAKEASRLLRNNSQKVTPEQNARLSQTARDTVLRASAREAAGRVSLAAEAQRRNEARAGAAADAKAQARRESKAARARARRQAAKGG